MPFGDETCIFTCFEDFKKCGEIAAITKAGKQIFRITCTYCDTVFLQFEEFIRHTEENHQDELQHSEYRPTAESKAVCSPITNNLPSQQTFCQDIQELKHEALQEENPTTSQDIEDPLEEHPLNIMPEESSKEFEDCTFYPSNMETETDGEEDEDDDGAHSEENIGNDLEGATDFNYGNLDIKGNVMDAESVLDSQEPTTDQEMAPDLSNNRNLTLAIIAGYEKHRVLWDANDANSKNRRKREEALRKICIVVNKEMGLELKWQFIGECIRKLRYKFRSQIQHKTAVDDSGKSPAPPWYLNRLNFLNSTITYKQRKKRGANALSKEKPTLPIPNLTHSQNVELIEIYKSFPCLWDVQHIGFRFKNQRQDALEAMLEAIRNKMNLDLTQDELQKKLYRIRYACTQEKHRKLQCERYEEQFEPLCEYYDHFSFLLGNVGPFKCAFCEETFNGADQYKIHTSKHDGSMPFTCPLCNRGFMKVGNCTVHLRRHTRDYPFECKICGKRYATSTDVNVHMRYHTGEKPYFCEVCGQSFRTWTFFDSHMRRHQKRPNHKCTMCPKAFYENNKLTEHMKAHLNVRDKICKICGKAFTCSKYLRQHEQIHAEKKKYSCKICNKDFAQYAGLSGHMKSHGTTISGSIAEEND